MKWWEWIIAAFVVGPIIYAFVTAVIVFPIIDNHKYNKKRKQWDIDNPNKKRKLCKDCKYSVSETLWSGNYYSWRIPVRVFSYCKLTKRPLKGNRKLLRCTIAEPPPELIAENEDATPAKGADTYCSAYGDTYHSHPKCSSIKNSEYVYKNAFFTLERRYCPKCWVVKDGILYPKNKKE